MSPTFEVIAETEVIKQAVEPVARPVLQAAIAVLDVLRFTRAAPVYQAAFEVLRVALRQLELGEDAR